MIRVGWKLIRFGKEKVTRIAQCVGRHQEQQLNGWVQVFFHQQGHGGRDHPDIMVGVNGFEIQRATRNRDDIQVRNLFDQGGRQLEVK